MKDKDGRKKEAEKGSKWMMIKRWRRKNNWLEYATEGRRKDKDKEERSRR